MAFFSRLSEEKQNELYGKLQANISSESQSMYNAALSKAKTKKQKAECAGQYKGSWFYLLEDWMNDKVTNLHVRDCLRANVVLAQ